MAVCACFLMPQTAMAFHPLASDDAATLGEAHLELELTDRFAHPSAVDLNAQYGLGLSAHGGLADRIDLGVTWFFESWVQQQGGARFGSADPTLDLKWRLADGRDLLPNLAVRLDYSPGGFNTLTPGGHDAGALLIASWDYRPLSIHLNVGSYGRELARVEHDETIVASSAISASLGHMVSTVLEGFYETSIAGEHWHVDGLGGFLFHLAPAWVSSLGAGPTWENEGRLGWSVTWGITVSLAPPTEEWANAF